jgi:DNA-directed RNA polymerase specialized sigma24 family protein
MRPRRLFGQHDGAPAGSVSVPAASARSEEKPTCQGSGPQPAQGLVAMAAERRRRSDDPAEAVARVSAAKRDVLLRVHGHRLGFEDLEDCFSQATLELVTRARTRTRAFVGDAHIANALEQRFLSRISDRRRALSGRSPIQAATHTALRSSLEQDGDEVPALAAVADPAADVAGRLAGRDNVRRLRELADELTADQRLVLACQVALDMDCHEFCARFGWSAEKFRKVAQRARSRLRVLVADYEAGERCRGLADDLAAYVAHVAHGEQSERVRRHLSNCSACAHTARELDRVARGLGALLPLPTTVDPEVVHRFGAVSRALGRLLPFWDSGESAAAAKAGAAGAAAAAGGGGAVTAGTSVLGLGAAKLGVTALCVAGAAGGYVVCDQIGLFSGPVPRERHHIATTANVAHKSPTRRAASPAVIRAPAPITHTLRQAAATAAPSASRRSSSSTASTSGQASSEFGFEGGGGTKGSAPSPSSSSSDLSARAASAGTQSAVTTPSAPRKPRSGSGHSASTEFGFE